MKTKLFPLTNVVLYAKGWYKTTDNIWEDLKKILELDDYTPFSNNDIYSILISSFEKFDTQASNLREGSPQGALRTTSASQIQSGFTIPAYATNAASSTGGSGKGQQAFSAWNIQSNINNRSSMQEPLAYSLRMNPRPGNQ